MKAINKFFYALLAFATVGMVACSEDNTYEPGAPEVEGCYDVYFPDANTLETQGPTGDVSLDPTEATEFTYTLYRNNTDGEIVVPVNVTKNTDNKFVVSEIKFLDGEDVAEFQVSLLESEIGVTYSFALSIDDPQYVKQYDSRNANSISINVTRVKWVDVGTCSFTEDVLTGYWNFGFNPANPTYDVKVQVRADSIDEAAFKAALDGTGSDAGLSGIYRIVNGWRVGVWADPEDTTLDSDPQYVVINANPYNKVWIPLQELGLTVNGGMTSIYSLAAYYYDNDETPTDDMFGKIEGGALTFPTRALLMCPGGDETEPLFYSNLNGNFKLVIAPKLGKYSLVLPEGTEDGDFEFSEVDLPEGALFYSESQALAAEPVLEKGKPAVNTDNADRAFVDQYGYLYRLPNLYAEGYPIYFGAKLDGTVTLHDDYAVQLTGLVQNGFEVYMLIDAEASKFDPETGLVNLVAEFGSLQGENFVSYGIYNETISVEEPDFNFGGVYDIKSDFTYAPLFTAPFTSKFMNDKYDATLEVGEGPGKGYFADKTPFRLPSIYAPGYDIYFVVGDEDGKVIIPAGFESQDTGVTVYGERVYMQIQNGTCSNKGVTLNAKFVNAEGEPVVAALCTESLVNYVWVDVATGTYTNGLMGDENGNPVPVDGLTLQNAEGTNIYRILEFWGYEDYHLNFTWDKGTNKCEVIGTCDTGYFYAGLGGNFHACDGLTGYALMGYELTWAQVEAQGVPQPTFNPATNTFTFPMYYVCWEAGKLYKAVDTFVLDGAVSEGPQWVDVDTGNYYSSLFIDDENYYIPFQGRKFQNLEGTNKYRVVNFTGADTDLNFTWDKTTNKCDIIGFNDTGVDSAAYQGKGNICVCDLLTFYKANGRNVTWEQLAAANDGVDFQSYFDPEVGEFVFYTIPAVPDMGPDVALGGGNIFTDYFVPDAAQAATTSSVKANLMSTSTVKEATINFNVAPRKRTLKGHTVGSVNLSYTKKSENKQTPVKRSIRENVKLNEKL